MKRSPKHRLIAGKVLAHPRVLRALPGEHEYDRLLPALPLGSARRAGAARKSIELGEQLVPVAADGGESVGKMVPSPVRREAKISQRVGVGARDHAAEIVHLGAERLRGLSGGVQDEPRTSAPRTRVRRWRLFQDQERVRASHSHRVDAGAARSGPVGKRSRGSVDEERGPFDQHSGVRGLEVQAGGDDVVLEREHGLHEAGHARALLQVTDVRLHRADRAESCAGCGDAE
jgi:hypothetical protein